MVYRLHVFFLRIMWLFNASTGLYPSAYLPCKLDELQRYNFVYGQVTEAKRIRSALNKEDTLPIHIYTRFQLACNYSWYTEVYIYNYSDQITRILVLTCIQELALEIFESSNWGSFAKLNWFVRFLEICMTS